VEIEHSTTKTSHYSSSFEATACSTMFYNPRLFFTAVLAVYTLPAAAQDAPPDGPVTVGPPSVVSTVDEGIACKVNSVGSMVALDKSVMTLIYDDLSATIGPGIPTKNRRGYCQVDIDVGIPPGYTFAVQASDYRGFGKLDKGVSGTVNATYGYPPKTETVRVDTLIKIRALIDWVVHRHSACDRACQR